MSALPLTSTQQSASTSSPNPLAPHQEHRYPINRVTLEMLQKMRFDPLASSSPVIKEDTVFTILFTSDTHSTLEPLVPPEEVKPFTSEKPLGGIVRRIKYLEQVRRLCHNPVLVLDAGDFLVGTPFFKQFQGVAEIDFINLASYDVITVGNHDFAMGWPHLLTLLGKGKFNTVCANICLQEKSDYWLPPYQLFEIAGQHIAIVGVMGESAWNSINQLNRKGLEIIEPMQALDQILPKIRPYVDLILLLSHAGIEEDRKLAKHPMVDIIIGGHSHTMMSEQELVNEDINGKKKYTSIFHSLCYGMLVGKMEVTFKKGKFSKSFSSVQRLDDQFDPQEEKSSSSVGTATALLNNYQQEMSPFKKVIGYCVEALSSEGRRNKLIPLGEKIANALKEIGSADVGFVYSGAIRAGIDEGQFTLGDLYRVYGTEHRLWLASIKGSLLRVLMQDDERRWSKGERTFQYTGLTLIKQGEEITTMAIGNSPLDNESFYKIAAPSFFFEREFMDVEKRIKPEFLHEINIIERREQDLRIPLAEYFKAKGLGS